MTITITRTYTFEAAHRLPRVPAGHKCKRLHGHHYVLVVEVGGAIDPAKGWAMDFAEVDHVVKPLVQRLDHHLLNEVPGLENPTAETIVQWISARLAALPLVSLVLNETPRSQAKWVP
jgi:6-pyruvoyltetrahydropterin/6-carboxytetrahydropterin synthase